MPKRRVWIPRWHLEHSRTSLVFMEYYPAFLELSGRRVVVVGAGKNASRRAQGLAEAGAQVDLIDPQANTHEHELVNTLCRDFTISDLDECWLVICASSNPQQNADILKLCSDRQIFCNVVNESKTSSYITPAIVDRSPLLIAITTGGVAPVLARAVKTKLESVIPIAYARLTTVVGRYQETIKQKIVERSERANFWHQFINGPVAELAFHFDEHRFEPQLQQLVNKLGNPNASDNVGFVSLVGAGPGDPDLLTFRALRLIQAADVLVYDRLVSESILKLRRDDAELIYAGKAKSAHTLPQTSINQLLVDLALDGKNVVRLKGGDPFIFGRGGEEIETLAQNGIKFQVVPGITAASGCAAFSGIPLTHRDYAQSCIFVTGHLQNGNINLNWQELRDPTQTIVVYMGLTGIEMICESLIRHGRSADTPTALIEQGTTPDQRVHTSTLASLPDLVATTKISPPTLLIIGGVVSLRDRLQWFEASDQA